MPGRSIPLVSGEVYHIYNRGVEKRDIFLQNRDYSRFLKIINYYRFIGPKPKFSLPNKIRTASRKAKTKDALVDVLSYCLLPNHFHFLLRQKKENGIGKFISQISNSHTRYINTKYKRVGPLLQGVFKSTHIENDDQLIHVSRYIHLNPVIAQISQDLDNYPWSSWNQYISNFHGFCGTETILGYFKNRADYRQFCLDQIDYAQSLALVKNSLIDIDG